MDVSTYILLSHEQALRRRMDVTANNLANAATAGFKREQPVFRTEIEQGDGAPVPDANRMMFVLDQGAVHDLAAGAFNRTGNPLDIMIDGPGYLAVTTPEGETAYTRAGHLEVSAAGELVTAAGMPVQGEGGRPIVIPPDQRGDLTIAADGTVAGSAGPLGRLTVTMFEESRVDPRGDGLMRGDAGQVLAADRTRLRSGGIEASNVQPIVETNTMVEILRAYQSSQRISDSINDMRGRAIDKLGRAD